MSNRPGLRPRRRVTTAAHRATLGALWGAGSLDGQPQATGSPFNPRAAVEEVDNVARERIAMGKIVASAVFWISLGLLGLGALGRSEARVILRPEPLGAGYKTEYTSPGGYASSCGSYAYRPPVVGVYVWPGRRALRSPVVFSYPPPHYYGHHYALEALPSVPLRYPGYVVAYPIPSQALPPVHGGTSWVLIHPSEVYPVPGNEWLESDDRERLPPTKDRAPNSGAPEIVPVPTPLEAPVQTSPPKPSPLGPKRGP